VRIAVQGVAIEPARTRRIAHAPRG